MANGSIRVRADLHFDPEKCIGCAACVVVCPKGAVQAVKEDGQGRITYDYTSCLYCRKCAYVCPQNAIEYKAVNEPADQLRESGPEDKFCFEYQVCPECGSEFLPATMIDKAVNKMAGESGLAERIELCPECRPRHMYEQFWAGKKK